MAVTKSWIAWSLCAAAGSALAQSAVPSGLQLEQAVGQRVEAFAVLSTQRAIQTGGYSFKIHDADASINRASVVIDLSESQPIGDTSLYWQPVVEVSGGASRFVNNFTDGDLAGNESVYDTTAVSGLIGPRLYLSSSLSITPAIGMLQAYTHNDFRAHNATGAQFEAANEGGIVDWDVVSLTTIPSLEIRYRRSVGTLYVDVRGSYARYTTQPVYRTTNDLDFASESASWTLRADVDYPTGLTLWHRPLRFGGTIARTQLLDGLQQSLNTNHFYRAGPRIMLDLPSSMHVLGSIGVGYTWVWGDGFSGYDVGLELEFAL